MNHLYWTLKAVETAGLTLFLIDWFVNAPMNGVWRLPGRWTKDDTVGYGLPAALLGGIGLTFLYDFVVAYKPVTPPDVGGWEKIEKEITHLKNKRAGTGPSLPADQEEIHSD